MVDAFSVLYMRYDGERSRAIPWRHTQIFGLESEAQSQLFAFEVISQNAIEGFTQRQYGQRTQQMFGNHALWF